MRQGYTKCEAGTPRMHQGYTKCEAGTPRMHQGYTKCEPGAPRLDQVWSRSTKDTPRIQKVWSRSTSHSIIYAFPAAFCATSKFVRSVCSTSSCLFPPFAQYYSRAFQVSNKSRNIPHQYQQLLSQYFECSVESLMITTTKTPWWWHVWRAETSCINDSVRRIILVHAKLALVTKLINIRQTVRTALTHHIRPTYYNLLFLLVVSEKCNLFERKVDVFVPRFPIFRRRNRSSASRAGRCPEQRNPWRQNWRHTAMEYACQGCSVEFQQRYP